MLSFQAPLHPSKNTRKAGSCEIPERKQVKYCNLFLKIYYSLFKKPMKNKTLFKLEILITTEIEILLKSNYYKNSNAKITIFKLKMTKI